MRLRYVSSVSFTQHLAHHLLHFTFVSLTFQHTESAARSFVRSFVCLSVWVLFIVYNVHILSLTWFLFDIENDSICKSSFSYKHSRACASIKLTSISKNCGFKSMLGAFVNVSCICLNIPAARRKLSTAMSRPFSVLRSCLVAICVYTPAKLNRIQAFSNATVRWLDGIPKNWRWFVYMWYSYKRAK